MWRSSWWCAPCMSSPPPCSLASSTSSPCPKWRKKSSRCSGTQGSFLAPFPPSPCCCCGFSIRNFLPRMKGLCCCRIVVRGGLLLETVNIPPRPSLFCFPFLSRTPPSLSLFPFPFVSPWIRQGAVECILAMSEKLGPARSFVCLIPCFAPFLKSKISVITRLSLAHCLKAPLSRKVCLCPPPAR